VGKTSIFNLEDNYVFASYLIRLKTNSKLLLGEFLNYFLNSNPGQRAIKSKARRAVSQANVNARELESIKIPLPPLETQQKIVEKLSAVQEYKKKLLDQKQKLQELFESVLNKSFKGELAE
jgi:type I restriction enzyme S subunit